MYTHTRRPRWPDLSRTAFLRSRWPDPRRPDVSCKAFLRPTWPDLSREANLARSRSRSRNTVVWEEARGGPDGSKWLPLKKYSGFGRDRGWPSWLEVAPARGNKHFCTKYFGQVGSKWLPLKEISTFVLSTSAKLARSGSRSRNKH